MNKIFNKNKKAPWKRGPKHKDKAQASQPRRKPTDDRDLVDPVVYVGDLDQEKYPVLPLEKAATDKKEKEEPENPLNRRRTL